jgi:hypothetical protein
MTVVMYDSIDVAEIPRDAEAVAGYVGGQWPTWVLVTQRWPKAHRLSIAVRADQDADCLDVETGDATTEQAPGWVRRQQARAIARPVIYAQLSNMPGVLAALAAEGIHRGQVRIWTAHWGMGEHICGPACGSGLLTVADATQWTDRVKGRNLDQSLCADTFFATANLHHYEWFDVGPFPSPWGPLNERDVVEHYDGARQHWIKYRLFLGKLRDQCGWLAGRVLTVAHEQPGKDGSPSWEAYHRGWRYQQLIHRSQGRRFV